VSKFDIQSLKLCTKFNLSSQRRCVFFPELWVADVW